MPTGQADRLMPTLRRVVLARQAADHSDGDLLGAFVTARAAEAFAELVRRHGPMVLGVCRRVVGDRTAADDAFQAAFLVLARRAAAVRPREQVGNYLYGVAYRTALKARTVLARRRAREKQVDVMPEPPAPPARTDWADLLPVIDEELARLPVKLRVPVVLCDLEGRTQREVARHLNVPPATLATRLAAARRTLAARLTRRGVTLSGGALAGLLGVHAAAPAVPPALAGGAARAAGAVAAGTPVHALVSANAVQLSEGVMRMMMLAKLKAAAALAVTALALTTGLGLGLVPAAAGDRGAHEEAGGPAPRAKPAAPPAGAPARPKAAPEPEIDDATFLRRLCLDVCGLPPTPVEMWFFLSDPDADKRAKVVDWMADDDAARAHLAERLGVPVERVKVLRARVSADGRFVEFKLAGAAERFVTPLDLALAADGGALVAHGNRLTADALRVLPENKNVAAALAAWVDVGADAGVARGRRNYTWHWAIGSDEKTGRVFEGAPPLIFKVADVAVDDSSNTFWLNELNLDFVPADSDAEFLKRVLADVRGNGPTALELKYFTEDKDPKKREKLLDTLLKEPAAQKKLGDAWKAKMLAPKPATFKQGNNFFLYAIEPDNKGHPNLILPNAAPQHNLLWDARPTLPPPPPNPPAPDNFEKLVGELIAAKKSDEAILEALTLATLGRLPTDGEKRLTLAGVGTTADRRAAWVAVARALAGADEAKKPDYARPKAGIEPPPAPPAAPGR